jgi:hypothetical protein
MFTIIKGKTTGQILYNELTKDPKSINANFNNFCFIATDGAPNMVGKISGFAGNFLKRIQIKKFFLHCIIHQDILCRAALYISSVLDVVVKLINVIRSRGLIHRQFQEFLSEIDANYSDLIYYTKFRWLSCGFEFIRAWSLLDNIKDF